VNADIDYSLLQQDSAIGDFRLEIYKTAPNTDLDAIRNKCNPAVIDLSLIDRLKIGGETRG
jgi:hypothetical protein